MQQEPQQGQKMNCWPCWITYACVTTKSAKQGLGRAYAGSHFECIGVTFIRSRETVSICLLLQGFCEESEQLCWQPCMEWADVGRKAYARYVVTSFMLCVFVSFRFILFLFFIYLSSSVRFLTHPDLNFLPYNSYNWKREKRIWFFPFDSSLFILVFWFVWSV